MKLKRELKKRKGSVGVAVMQGTIKRWAKKEKRKKRKEKKLNEGKALTRSENHKRRHV